MSPDRQQLKPLILSAALSCSGLVFSSAPVEAQSLIDQGLRLFQQLNQPPPPAYQPSRPVYQSPPPPAYQSPPPTYRQPAPRYAADPAPGDLDRDAVRDLQRLLVELGYLDGDIDGIVGPQTRRAIARFEATQGLPGSGRPTPEVLQAARDATQRRQARPGDQKSFATPMTPAPPPTAALPARAGNGMRPGTWLGSITCRGQRLPLRLEVGADDRAGRMQAGAGEPFAVELSADPASGIIAILPEPRIARAPRAPIIALEGRPASDGGLAGTVLGQCEDFALRPPAGSVAAMPTAPAADPPDNRAPDPAPVAAAPADTLTRQALPVVHLPVTPLLREVPNETEAVARALTLAWWKANPGLLADPETTLLFASMMLPDSAREELLSRHLWAGRDEFARQRSLGRFRQEWLPRLLAEAPALPFRYVEIVPMTLAAYQESPAGFGLSRLTVPYRPTWREAGIDGYGSRFLGHAIRLDRDPPRLLPMDAAAAEHLLERKRRATIAAHGGGPGSMVRETWRDVIDAEARVVFLRVEIEVTEPVQVERPRNGGSWTARIARMDLYDDVALRNLLLDDAAIRAADPATALVARAAQPITPPVSLVLVQDNNFDEALFLLALRGGSAAIGDETWQRAARLRLWMDRQPAEPPWGRFFPQDFRADRLGDPMPEQVDAYRAWSIARAAALPSVLWLPNAVRQTGRPPAQGQPLRLEVATPSSRRDLHPNTLAERMLQVTRDSQLPVRFLLPQPRESYAAMAMPDVLAALGPSRTTWLRLRIRDIASGADGLTVQVEPDRLVIVSVRGAPDAEPRIETPFLGGETEAEQRQRIAAEAAAARQSRAAAAAGRLAILGVRPGMPLAEARRAIETHLGPDAIAFVPASDPAGSPQAWLFDASVLFARPDGSERIGLFASRRDAEPVVVGVRRELVFAEGRGPAQRDFAAQLEAHYGRPNETVGGFDAAWFGGLEPSVQIVSGSSIRCNDRLREVPGIWRTEGGPRFGVPRYEHQPIFAEDTNAPDACGVRLITTTRLAGGGKLGGAVLALSDPARATRLAALPGAAPVAGEALGFAAGFPDILGLRPGMTLAEAEPLATAHLPDATVLVADAANTNLAPQNHPALASGRLFVDPVRQEALVLMTEPDAGESRVVAVLRHLLVPAGGPDIATIAAGLIAKYGEPAQRNSTILRWGNAFAVNRNLPTQGSCVMVQMRNVRSEWRTPAGAAPDGAVGTFLQRMPMLRVDPLGPGYGSAGAWRRVLECPTEVGAELREVPQGGVALQVWAIDPGATDEIMTRIRAGAASARQAEAAPERGTPGSGTSIRF